MANNNITDSRDMDNKMWDNFIKTTGTDQSTIRDLLETANDMVNIPELMDYLKNYNGNLTGYGINECLKEVEIALMALNKPYNVLPKYTY